MERKFDFVEVTLDGDYNMIKEVYRLHKEQSRKIFDLSSNISTDEDIMDYVKNKVEYGVVLLAINKDNGDYAGCIIMDDIRMFDGTITCSEVHLAINKKYWGKGSREIINNCFDFIKENMKPIVRLEAFVPSNNYGIIKLLKDVGFKVEGTLKKRLIFNNKNNIPTYYNELVYSKILGE